MLKDLTRQSLTNEHDIVSYYSGIRTACGPAFLYGNSNAAFEDDQFSGSATNSSEAVVSFLKAMEADTHFSAVVGRALGVFDGRLYLWLFIEDLDTGLTHSLFSLKAAVEQKVGGDFEIHVEPLGERTVAELTPSDYLAI